MKFTQPGLFLVVASALLSGCASTMSPTQMLGAQQIESHQNVTHGASDIQAHYALGKYHLSAGRAALAREEFLRALSLDRNNAEVRNGLASAYMQLADVDQAIEHLTIAVAMSPEASHLQSNLGYALLLKGRYRDSAEVLRRAMALDPENVKARQNWLALKSKVEGQQATQPQPVASAISPPTVAAQLEQEPPVAAKIIQSQHVVNIDFDRPVARPVYTVNFGSGDLPPLAIIVPPGDSGVPAAPDRKAAVAPVAQAPSPTLGAQPSVGSIVTPVRKGDDLVVRRVSLQRNDAGALFPDRTSAHAAGRIEISNGNGVGRMAIRVTQRLRELDLVVARVSNADRFNYPTTRIFFREGYAAEAKALSRLLPVKAELVVFSDGQMTGRIDVRVVIGGDFVAPVQIEQINPAPPAPVARAYDLSNG